MFLVPVSDPAGGNSTRTAFTLATGFVMGSSKNEDFQAGILVGRDFLGRNDRARDPGSKNLWVSFYVGFALFRLAAIAEGREKRRREGVSHRVLPPGNDTVDFARQALTAFGWA